MGLKQRAVDRVDRSRARSRTFDHLVRTWQHYRRLRGDVEAGAVTYFAFLSLFPVLALAFFVVGYVARVYPAARDNLVSALEQVLPGVLGNGPGQLSLDTISQNAATVGVIGLLGVVYSGLAWVAAMGQALQVVFETPRNRQPNFVVGKLRDLATLALIGLTLIVSVAVSGLVTGLSQQILDWVGLAHSFSWLLVALAVLVGVAANMVLFFAMFKLLATPPDSNRALWSGALLGALGFEVLKQLSTLLLQTTKSQPAFQAFGIALILLVWINYFSRLVLYAAAWAATAHAARVRNQPPPAESAQVFTQDPPSRRELSPPLSPAGERLASRVASARALEPAELSRSLRSDDRREPAPWPDRRRLLAIGAAAGVLGSAVVRALIRRG